MRPAGPGFDLHLQLKVIVAAPLARQALLTSILTTSVSLPIERQYLSADLNAMFTDIRLCAGP